MRARNTIYYCFVLLGIEGTVRVSIAVISLLLLLLFDSLLLLLLLGGGTHVP